ncbi:MAG: NAD(P)/FAD-dependent oxidoreductase [Oxalicibacterium faecigallinarum]|uniref:NAD(P)/FAD-dependent oxidoreductase n=1 Tax=Oxalicibacterium faecigallinarum TaxID=573741 RepID=UPI00280A1A31|nr:NAD(P)/FAD-dependent oxidoreductase [Oxalicibacterium faecigallinarum]MDQ7968218.1 NAD(P)/FAD-dependent oxidoreductase [Oxalicibacterium faecigallinarum]
MTTEEQTQRPQSRPDSLNSPHRIVIVGGGAGGLELATTLGNKLHERVKVVLVDRNSIHIWKPLLHEVAAGSMDANAHQLEYAAQARWHRFVFQQGDLCKLDRARKIITVGALLDDNGEELIPAREIPYDTLVLAIGSVTNFFNVPGAAEHAIALDALHQAEHFRRRMISMCMRADRGMTSNSDKSNPQMHIAIIGGGATGVELSAELRNTAEVLGAYGLHHLDPHKDIRISVIEAAPRILSALPEPVSAKTTALLQKLDIDVLTSAKVAEVRADSVVFDNGNSVPADLTVWAAGIKAPAILAELDLPINRLGQVVVKQTLQTEVDPDIFAFGDCAACPWPEKNSTVPPRAQAAHQQADFLFDAIKRRLNGEPLQHYTYKDLGSLVSLGRFDAVGNLMGPLVGSTLFVEGLLARLLYISLYRMHLVALHGWLRTTADSIGQWLQRKTSPRVKLH